MCEKCRLNCEDCRRLEERYGESMLEICEYCGHYYTGEACSCGDAQQLDRHGISYFAGVWA